MSKKLFLITCSILLLMPIMSFAGDGHEHAQKNIDNPKGEITTFEGTIVCKSCSLKQEFGARAACKENGCSHSLKTADGQYIDFLDNKYAKDLKGNKYTGKNVKITGTFFAKANIIDVQTISQDGKVVSWCDNCSAMDGCAAKK